MALISRFLASTAILAASSCAFQDAQTEITGRALEATVQIKCDTSQGSGYVISRDGLIATANHVMKECDNPKVVFANGTELKPQILGQDDVHDVALLKVTGDYKPIPWANSDEVRPGERVFVIGNPFGLGLSVSEGIISAVGRVFEGLPLKYLQFDAAANPGNSGGPVINEYGYSVGMAEAIYGRASPFGPATNIGIGAAIPSNVVRKSVDAIFHARPA